MKINYLAIQQAELARVIEGHNIHHPTSDACYICYLIKNANFNFASKQQEDFFKRRSGEMADTEDLKSSALKEHEGSSPSSGITYNDLTRNPNQTLDGKLHPSVGIPDEALKDLMRAHECLLNTLAPSKSSWIRDVHHNAKAYYQTWLKKHIMR